MQWIVRLLKWKNSSLALENHSFLWLYLYMLTWVDILYLIFSSHFMIEFLSKLASVESSEEII